MKTSKMTSAIVIGIMAVLTLTLNIWGNEWYKVLTSLLAGVIVGIAIYDYKFFTRAFRVTKVVVTKKVINRKKTMALSKESKQFAVNAFQASISLTIYFFALAKFWHVVIESQKPAYQFFFWMYFVLLLSSVLIYLMYKEEDKKGYYVDKIIRSFIIRAGKLINRDMNDEKNFFFVSLLCWPVTIPITLIICIVGLSGVIIFLFLGILKVLIYCVIFSMQIIISIPLFIGYVFKAINQNNDAMIIAWSIAFGGLIGTIASSYLIGIGFGLVIMICSLISNKFEIKPDLFIQGEYNLAQKFAKRF